VEFEFLASAVALDACKAVGAPTAVDFCPARQIMTRSFVFGLPFALATIRFWSGRSFFHALSSSRKSRGGCGESGHGSLRTRNKTFPTQFLGEEDVGGDLSLLRP
jgi:hypothetical protein